EEMTVICSAEQYENARARLNEQVRVIEMSTNESWVQDKGAFYLINDNGGIRGVQFGFNGYGGVNEGLYFPWDLDMQVVEKLCELVDVASYQGSECVWEGGVIQVEGTGTIVINEQCRLNPNRKGEMCKKEVE